MPEQENKMQNNMKDVFVDKVVVNIGVGEAGEEVKKAEKIIKLLTGKSAIQTKAKVRLPTWGIRPGLPIGCKTTLRGQDAVDFLKLTLRAKRNKLKKKSFTQEGNFSYGIYEYLDVPGIKYAPELGIRGFDVCVNLKRKGYRVKLRKHNKSKIGRNHKVSKEDAINFAKNNLQVVVE
jgi:large subunit ribosomal protein L5